MLRTLASTFRNQWAGLLALFLVLTGGTAYAVNEWTGANIVDGSLTTVDFKDNEVRSGDVRNDNLTNGGLQAEDLRPNSVGRSELLDEVVPVAWGAFPSTGPLCSSPTNCPLAFNSNVTSVTNPATGLYCIAVGGATPSTGFITAGTQDLNATVAVSNGPGASSLCGNNIEFPVRVTSPSNVASRSFWFEVLPVEAGLG